MKTSVHIAHYNDFMREGLRTILHQQGVTITGTSDTCYHMHEAIESQEPDVVVIDARIMQECITTGGIDAWGTHSVVTTSSPHSFELAQMIAAGAKGYVADDSSEDLLIAIETASAETHPIELETLRMVCQTITKRDLLAEDVRIERLTSAELRVLSLLSQGLCNRAIADQLNVTVNTIKTHLRHIFGKLSLSDRTQAALWGARYVHIDSLQSMNEIHSQE